MNEVAGRSAERPRVGEKPHMFGAEVIQVIRTNLERRGAGTPESPIRVITQFWTLDGQLLAEVDPVEGSRK